MVKGVDFRGTRDCHAIEHLGWVGGEGGWRGLVVAYGSLKGELINRTERQPMDRIQKPQSRNNF